MAIKPKCPIVTFRAFQSTFLQRRIHAPCNPVNYAWTAL